MTTKTSRQITGKAKREGRHNAELHAVLSICGSSNPEPGDLGWARQWLTTEGLTTAWGLTK